MIDVPQSVSRPVARPRGRSFLGHAITILIMGGHGERALTKLSIPRYPDYRSQSPARSTKHSADSRRCVCCYTAGR